MNKQRKNEEIIEIDLKKLWNAILRKLWVILLVSFVTAAIVLVGTVYLITPQYKSTALFYVNNNSLSVGGTAVNIDSGDITATKSLVQTYIVILNSREVLEDVIDYAEVDYSYGQLKSMLSASSVNSTEVFEVVITGPNPEEAERIADAITEILPNKISNIVEGTSAKVVDYAIRAEKPSSPDKAMNTVIGFLLGFVFSVAIVVIVELMDNTVRSENDVIQNVSHPILASVPDMLSSTKGGYYYDRSTKRKNRKKRQELFREFQKGCSYRRRYQLCRIRSV